jgi:hypothetical protein
MSDTGMDPELNASGMPLGNPEATASEFASTPPQRPTVPKPGSSFFFQNAKPIRSRLLSHPSILLFLYVWHLFLNFIHSKCYLLIFFDRSHIIDILYFAFFV